MYERSDVKVLIPNEFVIELVFYLLRIFPILRAMAVEAVHSVVHLLLNCM